MTSLSLIFLAAIAFILPTAAVSSAETDQKKIIQPSSNDQANKLLTTASALLNDDKQTSEGYLIAMDCCLKLIDKYPDSTEAEKAKILINQIPQKWQRWYNKEIKQARPKSTKVKKTKSLRSDRFKRRMQQMRLLNSGK